MWKVSVTQTLGGLTAFNKQNQAGIMTHLCLAEFSIRRHHSESSCDFYLIVQVTFSCGASFYSLLAPDRWSKMASKSFISLHGFRHPWFSSVLLLVINFLFPHHWSLLLLKKIKTVLIYHTCALCIISKWHSISITIFIQLLLGKFVFHAWHDMRNRILSA